MHKINLILTNRSKATLATLLIFFFGFATIFFPLVLMYIIPQSGIGHYFLDHVNYAFIAIPALVYFVITGVYYYKIKIDPYVIDITSYRTVSGFFQKKDFVDIAHTMLKDYSFFDRPFTLNKTLMLKIETDTGKRIAKRFELTLISEREVESISSVLDRIIEKNN